jgi:hypothetical protein
MEDRIQRKTLPINLSKEPPAKEFIDLEIVIHLMILNYYDRRIN